MKKLLCIIIFIPFILSGQKLTLEQCLDMAVKNHPLGSKVQSIQDIHKLKKENIRTNRFPELNLNGQVTYQDPVVQFDMNTEGMPFQLEFPNPPNDQYKTWIDIKQNIYDGGIIKKSLEIEEQISKTESLEQEISIDKIKQTVTQIYFNILIIDIQIQQANLAKNELNEKLKTTGALVKRGVMLQSNYDGIKGEYLKLGQQIIALENNKKSLETILSRYLNMQFSGSLNLEVPETNETLDLDIKRKEYELFNSNARKISMYQELTKIKNRPKIYGFSQVGYGNPGLNMLNDSFEPYYIMGAGLSWNIFDWNQSKRNYQVQQIQKENIDLLKNDFSLEITTAIDKTKAEINTYKQLIESDQEIISTYKNIANVATSRFENGEINSSEYLTDMNKEKQAILVHELNKLNYKKALVNLYLLTGNL